jgi:hypothetical protein
MVRLVPEAVDPTPPTGPTLLAAGVCLGSWAGSPAGWQSLPAPAGHPPRSAPSACCPLHGAAAHAASK